MVKQVPWFEEAFTTQYLDLYQHRSPEQGREQVQQMLRAGLLPKAGRVLDLCCGAGRHLHPMRAAGLHAVGLDLSMDLLRAGKLAGLAVRADARRVPFRGALFDVVTNLFSSFGYFDDDADHGRVLTEVCRVLKLGGRLVLDHMNAEVTRNTLQDESTERRGKSTVTVRRSFDAGRRRVNKSVEYRQGGRVIRQWTESVRVFTPVELDDLLRAAGMRTLGRYGDLDGSPFVENSSARQVVVAVRDSA